MGEVAGSLDCTYFEDFDDVTEKEDSLPLKIN
jgi:hypothetical protein